MSQDVTLKRSLSLSAISFYGLGTIIGAGIYILIGKVGAAAGVYLPYAFLLAGIIAVFTAFSYAELSSRYPQSAGTALYVYQASKLRWLAQVVAVLVAVTGIVSAATITNGFVGYLNIFVQIPDTLAIIGLVVFLAGVACWGINQSAIMISVITLVEVGGLIFTLYAGSGGTAVHDWSEIFSLPSPDAVSGIFIGSFLAFYAFIGFEDMVNVAEEVKNPRRNLPRAILIAIAASTLLYVIVSVLAVRMMSVEALASSNAPLADIVIKGGYSPDFIGLIALFAVINGALVQIIMASRLFYGMAQKNMAPPILGHLNKHTQTPIVATILVAFFILVFALWLPLITLAKITSLIMLLLFAMVNLSLIIIKYKSVSADENIATYPIIIPITGLILCLALVGLQIVNLIV